MPDFLTPEFFAVLLIFAVSALAQGILGFAFGIVAMTLLPLVLGFRDAVILLAVLNAAVMSFALFWQRASFRWGDARFLLIGSLIGIPIGAYLVGALPERVLYVLLGGTMMAISANQFIRRRSGPKSSKPAWELPVGLASGVLAAGFNMGGPPLVAYIYSRDWALDQAKAVLASCFMVTAFARLGFLGMSGVSLPDIFKMAAVILLPTVAMLWLGIKVGHRIPQRWLRPGVFVYLGMMGVLYLFKR
ncbi:MAG: hypothetical protein RIS54_155 [Verrucomicrobiota bacterium]|jgi:uncharacterized membrane protein YfcA